MEQRDAQVVQEDDPWSEDGYEYGDHSERNTHARMPASGCCRGRGCVEEIPMAAALGCEWNDAIVNRLSPGHS